MKRPWWIVSIACTAAGSVLGATIAFEVDPTYRLERGAIDGDTIRIAPLTQIQELYWAEDGPESVRLLCVSAPELHQPGGPEAHAWLASHVGLGPLELEAGPDRRDGFGRMLAFARVGGVDLNLEIVRQGLARFERRYPCVRRGEFDAVEAEARAARRGVWVSTSKVSE